MDDNTLQLLNRARESDRDAVGELFRRFRDPLRRALRRMLGDDYRTRVADSEDAAHDAILSALRGLEGFEYRGEGSFLAWLLKRAEHELLNRLKAARRKRRDPGAGPPQPLDEGVHRANPAVDLDLSVGGAARRNETRTVIRECLDELPDKERDVILLRQFMELDTAAICAELDLPSPSAVRNLYARAQARLALVLGRRGLGPESL